MKYSLYITILFVVLSAAPYLKCTKLSDFCFQKIVDQKCSGNYGFSCSPGLCTVTRFSCHSIKIWSLILTQYKTEKAYKKASAYYELFIVSIQECPEFVPKVWSTNDACLNSQKCISNIRLPFRLSSSKFNLTKLAQCTCNGKLSFTCGKPFCALDKSACNGLKDISPVKAFDIGVKVCQNKNF